MVIDTTRFGEVEYTIDSVCTLQLLDDPRVGAYVILEGGSSNPNCLWLQATDIPDLALLIKPLSLVDPTRVVTISDTVALSLGHGSISTWVTLRPTADGVAAAPGNVLILNTDTARGKQIRI